MITLLMVVLPLLTAFVAILRHLPEPRLPKPEPCRPLAPPPRPPEPEFDPLAFWLFPDWDGPDKEPFWMRPPLQPVRYRPSRGDANVMTWGQPRTRGVIVHYDTPVTCEEHGHDLIRLQTIGGPDRWRCLRCPHESESADVWQ